MFQVHLNDVEKCIFLLQSLKQELSTYEAQQEEIDERIKCLEAEQEQDEQELITLQGKLLSWFEDLSLFLKFDIEG